MKKYVNSFKELEVYKLARKLTRRVYELTKKFPKEELYSLTDQFRRASRSVGASIAEAWGKKRYEAHFISKLTDSDAEQLETQHWTGVSFECEYLIKDKAIELNEMCLEIGRMLNSMIDKAETFCNPERRH